MKQAKSKPTGLIAHCCGTEDKPESFIYSAPVVLKQPIGYLPGRER